MALGCKTVVGCGTHISTVSVSVFVSVLVFHWVCVAVTFITDVAVMFMVLVAVTVSVRVMEMTDCVQFPEAPPPPPFLIQMAMLDLCCSHFLIIRNQNIIIIKIYHIHNDDFNVMIKNNMITWNWDGDYLHT